MDMCDEDERRAEIKITGETSCTVLWDVTLITGSCYNTAKRSAHRFCFPPPRDRVRDLSLIRAMGSLETPEVFVQVLTIIFDCTIFVTSHMSMRFYF